MLNTFIQKNVESKKKIFIRNYKNLLKETDEVKLKIIKQYY